MTIKTPKLKRKSDLILLAGPFGWTDESRNDEWLILAKAFPGVGIRVGSFITLITVFWKGLWFMK